jgi:WD40 repeat protein
MLALRPAFCETDVNRLIKRITDAGPPALRRRCRHVPRDLETIVLRATARDPADRYQSADRLAEDLGLFLADRPIRAQRASPLQRVRAWSRRNPLAAGLSVLVLVLLVAVAAVAITAAAMLREERDTAVVNLNRAEAAEGRLREELRSSHVAQARVLRTSKRQGQRFDALDQLARAARIRPSDDLRDDVIASLALLDVRTLRHWTREEEGRPHAVDPAGRRYAHVAADGDITLYRIADGVETLHLRSPGGIATVACFSPDGGLLGTIHRTGKDSVFRVWDLERAAVVAEARSCDRPGTADFDGRGHAVVGGPDDDILILDLADSGTRSVPGLGETPLGRLRWSPDGSRIAATAVGGHEVRILDPEGNHIRTLEFTEMVFDVAWHPRVDRLAVAAGTEVRILDADGREVRTLQGHHGIVSRVDFDATGSLIASAGWDRRTVLWDAATGEQHLVLPRAAILTGSYLRASAGEVETWLDEIVPSPCVGNIDEHVMWAGPVTVGFCPDRRVVAVASLDRVRLFDLARLEEVATLPLEGVLLVAPGKGGELVTATSDRILAWPIADDARRGILVVGPPTRRFEAPARGRADPFPTDRDVRYLRALLDAAGPVPLVVAERDHSPYMALSGDGRWVLRRVWQAKEMHVWDLESRVCVCTIAMQNGEASFTPDGRYLFANPMHGPCRVLDTATWNVVREFETDPSGIAVSPDGALVAATAEPSGAMLLRLPDLEPIVSLQTGGALSPGELRFNQEGDVLAIRQAQRAQIWDLGRIRSELDRLGLAAGLPAWSAPHRVAEAGPVRVEVRSGEVPR